jgi:hypothetical protein
LFRGRRETVFEANLHVIFFSSPGFPRTSSLLPPPSSLFPDS